MSQTFGTTRDALKEAERVANRLKRKLESDSCSNVRVDDEAASFFHYDSAGRTFKVRVTRYA